MSTPRPRLELVGPTGPPRSVPVNRTPFCIGSDVSCDLRVQGPGVLARHAHIALLAGVYHLVPFPSARPPIVNGAPVGEGGTPLAHDSDIDLVGNGSVRLRFRRVGSREWEGADRLPTLMEIARAITSSLNIDEVLGRVLDGAIRFSGAERGYLFLREGDRLMPWTRDGAPPSDVEVSLSVAEEVARTGRPVYRDRLGDEGGRSVTDSIVRLRLQAILCVPLVVRNDAIGVVYLDSKRHLPHHQPDLPLLEALAGLAAIAIQNSRLVEDRVRAERTLAIGQMARAIVHDLRSPLASIRGLAELLHGRTDDGDPSRPHLATIISEVDRLTGLTGDLLQFSKETPPLESLEVKVADLVRQTLRPLQARLQQAGVRVDLELDEHARVRVDPGRILRVLHNLIANALDAMPGGGTLAIRCERARGQCAVTVADSGRGIPEEVRRRLFEPFVSHGKPHGTGLGLAIVRKIIEEHGGNIHIDSAPARGTRVLLDLPQAA